VSGRATYDVAVVGLGAMGSAVLARCAMRGVRTVGIEQFALGHDLGASTGKSRIIRKAYWESAAYVPLLLRAYELWGDVERRTGKQLLRLTGLLLAGDERSDVVNRTRAAAEAYHLPLEMLSTAVLRARYPNLRVRDGEVAAFEPDGGVVFPEAAVNAHLELAAAHGATMVAQTAVTSWDAGDTVRLHLSDGTTVEAASVVLTLGPWFANEMRTIGVPLVIQRNVQVWFEPSSPQWGAENFPAFLVDRPEQPLLYGFPDFGDGVKAAFHAHGENTTPQELRREATDDDIAPVTRALDAWMNGAAARFLAAKVCMYSLTPDRNFVIGLHPRQRNVVLCGGFSGHGFKFSSVVGEIGAQLAIDGATTHNVGFLSPERMA
jgi:sarcosine oxidase